MFAMANEHHKSCNYVIMSSRRFVCALITKRFNWGSQASQTARLEKQKKENKEKKQIGNLTLREIDPGKNRNLGDWNPTNGSQK